MKTFYSKINDFKTDKYKLQDALILAITALKQIKHAYDCTGNVKIKNAVNECLSSIANILVPKEEELEIQKWRRIRYRK